MTFVPVTALPSMTLRDVTVTFANGVLADITEITIERTIEKNMRTPGPAKVARTDFGVETAKLTFKGFNSSALSFGDLRPRMRVAAISVKSNDTANASVLQSDFFTLFPVSGWAIGDTKTGIESKPSTWEVEVIPNVGAGADATATG